MGFSASISQTNAKKTQISIYVKKPYIATYGFDKNYNYFLIILLLNQS